MGLALIVIINHHKSHMIATPRVTIGVMEKTGKVAEWLSQSTQFRVTCVIKEPIRALEDICRISPEMLILDLSMEGEPTALDLSHEILMRGIPTRVIVVSEQLDPVVTELAFAVGVSGCAELDCDAITTALTKVKCGSAPVVFSKTRGAIESRRAIDTDPVLRAECAKDAGRLQSKWTS